MRCDLKAKEIFNRVRGWEELSDEEFHPKASQGLYFIIQNLSPTMQIVKFIKKCKLTIRRYMGI